MHQINSQIQLNLTFGFDVINPKFSFRTDASIVTSGHQSSSSATKLIAKVQTVEFECIETSIHETSGGMVPISGTINMVG